MAPSHPNTRELLRLGGSLAGVTLAAVLFFSTARPLLADVYLISAILGGELLGRTLVAIYDKARD